jgi:hypothetical protein
MFMLEIVFQTLFEILCDICSEALFEVTAGALWKVCLAIWNVFK